MSGLDSFDLQLYGSGIYFGGQTIWGKVVISSNTKMTNIENIRVKLTGFADVHWTEFNDEHVYHYRNHEEYLKNEIVIHNGYLPVGLHAFPFSFILPANLPSSFEGQHGHVRYYVETKLVRSGFFTLTKKKQFVTINSLVDLNQIQGVESPQTSLTLKHSGVLLYVWTSVCNR